MKSSRKLLKSNQFVMNEQSKSIHTVLEKKTKSMQEIDGLSEKENRHIQTRLNEIHDLEAETERLHQETKKEKEMILMQAKGEADQLKKAAEKEGFAQGETEGYSKGYEEGQSSGYQEAEKAMAELRQEALDRIDRVDRDLEVYKQTVKSELLQLAVSMAEKIVHQEIMTSEDGLLELVKPQLDLLDMAPGVLTIFVHPSHVNGLKGKMDQLKELSIGTKFIILPDRKLDELGCVIESNRAVVNLDVKKQLDAMLKELERA